MMDLRVTHTLNSQGLQELRAIEELEKVYVFGTAAYFCRAVENISTTVKMMGAMLCNSMIDVAFCVHRLVQWFWQNDVHAERECAKQFWNTFIARPIKLLVCPLRIVHEPLYRRLALYIDYDSYTTKFEGPLVFDTPILQTATEEAEKIYHAFERSIDDVWPLPRDIVLADYGREHHLFLQGSSAIVELVNRYVHTLQHDNADCPTSDEYLAFYRDRIGFEDATMESLKSYYAINQQQLCARVKYNLAKEYLLANGINEESCHILALKAMACSSQGVWKALKGALSKVGAQVCLIENNLIVTDAAKVILELKFTNYPPATDAWTVRDIIRIDSEHHEGAFRLDLTSNRQDGTLEVLLGNGNTGWSPRTMQGGTFVADGPGHFIPLFDTPPPF